MPNLTDVYVAASSGEIERARKCMRWLSDAGLTVVSKWIELIEEHGGDANPRDATPAERLAWTNADLAQVASAGTFWLLAPGKDGGPGRGAWGELCYAHALGDKLIVASGDSLQSIFGSLAIEIDDDHEALLFILRTVHEKQRSLLQGAGYYAVPSKGAVDRNYVADITVSCARCGLPFHFVGAPAGLSFYRPMVDVPGTTLHAPIAPGRAPVPDGIRIEFQRGNEA